ncbi:peptide ABC transporter permease [Pseudoscardovia radai]|uniref:Peptide ABC transporter permease n=1 Tax=Pseudoscardovia radai TaxID=987066 RepID=A0A261EXT9_9BIFI|nr:ABC transporter permease [Pseudoscardovia radai]OZG51657.1 peptide ABC transporter permease [Pseudoscardovia radai]
MTAATHNPSVPSAAARHASGSSRLRRAARALRRSPMTLWGLVLLLAIVIVCFVIPVAAHMDAYTTDTAQMLESPSGAHPMGTDNLGRDILTRVLLGGKSSLTVGFLTAVISGFLGLVLGLYAAYYPKLGYVIMRLCDGVMAFPAILFGIVFVEVLGQSTQSVVAALSIVLTPYVARVVRSSAMSTMNENYVQVLIGLGAGGFRILWRNIALNVIASWIVEVTFVFADAILVEAAMSFIGAGIPQPTPTWGNMLYDSRTYIYNASWMTLFPGLALALTVFVINMLGDGLRETLDPKRRGQ